MISQAQRKLFFAYCNKIGEDRARAMLVTVTKESSTRSERLSVSMMNDVLNELCLLYGKVEHTISKGKDVICLRTSEQKKRISELKEALGLRDQTYVELCRGYIRKDEPLTTTEADVVIYFLSQKLKKKVKH